MLPVSLQLPRLHRAVLGYVEPALLGVAAIGVAYRPRAFFALLDPEAKPPAHAEPTTAARMSSIQAIAGAYRWRSQAHATGWAFFAAVQLVAIHVNQDPAVLKALVYAGLVGDSIWIASLIPLLRSMANRMLKCTATEYGALVATFGPTFLRLDLARRLNSVAALRSIKMG